MEKGSGRRGLLDFRGPELEGRSERGGSRAGRMEHWEQWNRDPWGDRRGLAEAAKKLWHAAIHVTAVEGKPSQAGGGSKK
jgi:hypothetical protein